MYYDRERHPTGHIEVENRNRKSGALVYSIYFTNRRVSAINSVFFQDERKSSTSPLIALSCSSLNYHRHHVQIQSHPEPLLASTMTKETARSGALATIKLFESLERSLRLKQHGNRRPVLTRFSSGSGIRGRGSGRWCRT